MSEHDPLTADRSLLAELEAFGRTLESTVGEPIRPSVTPVIAPSPPLDRSGWDRLRRPTGWLIAAAVLVAVGFGLGLVWSDRSDSIDSVGTPNQRERTEQTTTVPSSTSSTEVSPVTPATPTASRIEARDGSVLGMIDDSQGQSRADDRVGMLTAAIVDELVRFEAFDGLGRDELADLLTTGGLVITTTLDETLQDEAMAAIEELYPNETDQPFQVGVVTIDNRTGAIAAITSSDPASAVALDTPRPPGSAFKTVVLAALFEAGYEPTDLVRADGPCRFETEDGGDPYTVGGSFRGPQSIAAVTRSSNNCAYVRLGQVVGLDRVVRLADELGLVLPDGAEQWLSLPLGVAPLTAVDLTGAYATFANEGLHRTPWLVTTVRDAEGNVVHRHLDAPTEVVSTQTAEQVGEVLRSNVEAGTGKRAALSGGHQAAGKTGTTNGFEHAWFVGWTDHYTTSVWLGDPVGDRPIRIPGWRGFGGGLPAAIWGRYMDEVHRELTARPVTDESSADPDPSTGVDTRYLTVPGEVVLCDTDIPAGAEALQAVDQNDDGQVDCFRPVPG